MRPFEMAFPESVADASDLLSASEDARLVAGGTALGVVMKEGIYQPELLINVRSLEDELGYVREADDAIHVGALATLREIEQHEAIGEYCPTVRECLEEIAGVRVRNTATIGGHLAHADIHLDLPPVLAGYDARVVVSDGSETREVPIAEFMYGYYETDLADDELITEVVLPKPDGEVSGTYFKHRYFSEVDWPCVGVAAFVERANGSVGDVRVLLNSVSHSPIMEVEGIDDVVDGELTEEAIEAVAELAVEQSTPTDDLRGSAAYKERMAGVFTRRALQALAGDGATEGST